MGVADSDDAETVPQSNLLWNRAISSSNCDATVIRRVRTKTLHTKRLSFTLTQRPNLYGHAIPRRFSLAIGEEDAIRAQRNRTWSDETRHSMSLSLLDGQLDVCKIEEASLSRAKPTSPTGERPMSSVICLVLAVVACQALSQATNETLTSRDRACGDLVCFGEYVFCSIASGPSALRARRVNGGWQVGRPLLFALSMTSLGYAILLNMTMETSLPMPMLIILKNGNLVANLIVGFVLFGCRYNTRQVAAVVFVTAGLAITTLAGRPSTADDAQALNKEAFIGVCFLTCGLLLRAIQGSLQEVAVKACGCSPASEIIFWRSMLGFPMSLLKMDSISKAWRRWNEPTMGGLVWPAVWGLLCANLLCNFVVKVLMSRLIKETSALAAALTLTAQRFISFVLFAAVLNPNSNETNAGLWIGGAATLIGTFAYSLASLSDGSERRTDKSR